MTSSTSRVRGASRAPVGQAAFLALGALALGAAPARAQTFESGSTGAEGALTFAAGAGTIDFDPDGFTPPLDPDRDGVYHFTTITIPAGTTVRLSARTLGEGRPIVWLASGAVVIAGTLDLNGATGHDWNQTFAPAFPGAGGYTGGVGSALVLRFNTGRCFARG